MSDYYGGYGCPSDRKPRRSLLGRLFDLFMTVITVMVAVAAVGSYAAPFISPALAWPFSILGLAAPAIYLAVLLLVLYWIVRWRWMRASLMLALAVVGALWVLLFYKPEFRRVYEQPQISERGTIRFMTYNVRNFFGEDGKSSAESILKLVVTTDPDIVCMQEFNPGLTDGLEAYELFREAYPYVVGGGANNPATAMMAVFSKYPLLRWGPSRESVPSDGQRESIWADLRIGDDTVRVFNNHLHSTAINAADNEFITKHRYISDSARDVKIRSIVRRLRDNNILRAEQVDSIAVTIRETPYARIVCGDFNDTPMSYVYRTMASDLNDAFRDAGTGYSHTFRGFFNMLRIDYVLFSDDFEACSYEVPEADYSDHLPVVVQLRYTPRH